MIILTWSDIDEFVEALAAEVKDRSFAGVYGLPRGGLVIAVILSHRLNIPLLSAPCEECLVVDDICDSGESLLHICRNSSGRRQKNYVATVFYKRNDLGVKPDFFWRKKKNDWVLFPWEYHWESVDV